MRLQVARTVTQEKRTAACISLRPVAESSTKELAEQTRYALHWASEESSFDPRQEKRFFCSPMPPDRLSGPLVLLTNGTVVFFLRW